MTEGVRVPRRFRPSVGCAALLALHSHAAFAFTRVVGPATREPVRWPSDEIVLSLSERTLPSGVSKADAMAALEAAADVWKRGTPCARLRFRVELGHTDEVLDDRVNIVAFRRQAWCRNDVERPAHCYDASRAALTTLHFASSGAVPSEHISGADIELNAVHFAWNTEVRASAASRSRPPLGLAFVLAHELGHVLGFGHPCAAPGERPLAFVDHRGRALSRCNVDILRDAGGMMTPAAERSLAPRELSSDDVNGVCSVYGTPTSVRPTSSACGCRLPGHAPGEATSVFVVAALAAYLLQRRRHAGRQSLPREPGVFPGFVERTAANVEGHEAAR